MALKKGFCTHCEGEETLRLFDVNDKAEICYCPHCMAEMQPKEAIDNYRELISFYLKKASKALFESTEYLVAYQTFAHIIDLNDTIKVAYFGRLLALVYLSTLRESKINFAYIMHRQEAKDKFHFKETSTEYFNFLILLLDALDQYETNMKKRLLFHDCFYDLDCIILYLKRVEEIRSYKDFIASEANFFFKANKEQFKEIIDRVDQDQAHYDAVFKETYPTLDGYSYIFYKFDNQGLPLVTLKDGAHTYKIHHFRNAFLYDRDNKKSRIRDDIYLSKLTLSRLISVSVPLAIVFFLLAVGAAIGGFFINAETTQIIVYSLAALLTSVSLMLVILYFVSKHRYNKKYYSGTNPFIFK